MVMGKDEENRSGGNHAALSATRTVAFSIQWEDSMTPRFVYLIIVCCLGLWDC